MHWIHFLLFSSAFFHALWNAVAKVDKQVHSNLLAILVVAALLGPAAMYLTDAYSIGNFRGFVWGIASGLFEAAYMFALVRSFKTNYLGVAYTIMRGGAMISVWLVSWLFLGEAVTPITYLGVALVLLGLGLVHFDPSAWGDLSQHKWPLLAALFIAGYHICYGQSLDAGAEASALYTLSMVTAVSIFLIGSGKVQVLQSFERLKARPKLLGGAGFLSALSFVIFLVGLRGAHAGHAITIRNTSIVWAQIFSLCLGERISPRQWAGALVVMMGATLVSL